MIMPKSIELLKTEKYEKFLTFVDTAVLRMSDFERFAFVCENISPMVGSRFRDDFLCALECDLGAELSLGALRGRENQKKLWKIIHGSDVAAPITELQSPEILPNIDNSQPKNLNSLLLQGELPNDIDIFADRIGESIMIDISGLKYQRPDGYHSDLTYQKLRKGEEYGSEEFCALICFVICRVMMKRQISLYLIADENMETAEKILHLFESRGLDSKIYICFFPDKPNVRKATELCLNSRKKNISPEIIISEENDFYENIRELFAEIPALRIYFCEFLSNEKGKQEFQRIFKIISQGK